MKKTMLLCALLLCGCDDPPSGPAFVTQKNVTMVENRWSNGVWEGVSHDEQRHVTCWHFGNGLSCMPDWMLEPPKAGGSGPMPWDKK